MNGLALSPLFFVETTKGGIRQVNQTWKNYTEMQVEDKDYGGGAGHPLEVWRGLGFRRTQA